MGTRIGRDECAVEGKDVLTLQTCTLPDYSQRMIVQAEKEV